MNHLSVITWIVLIASLPWGIAAAAVGKVFVDQLGYLPNAPKVFFSTQAADSFFVVDVASNAIRFAGRISPWKSSDPASGMTLFKGDFTSLRQAGKYRVLTSGRDTSFAFIVSDTVFQQAYRASLKAFYYQRCGIELTPMDAGAYQHAKCHLSDGFLHTSTNSSGYQAAAGGWHDAGDYGKYVVNAGVTVGTLLMAYELFPQRFSHDDIGIPESGNGVPDLLDEVRFELEWLLKMQAANGGVYFKLTRQQFEGFVMPQDDSGVRYVYAVSSTATGNVAAVMARAARIYRPFDRDFADTCLARAQRAWSFLESNPTIMPAGGFRNPSGTGTGEYGDTQDRDERLWAAAELFLTTGMTQFNNYYALYYTSRGLFTTAMSWQNVTAMAHLTYLTGARQDIDTALQNQLRSSLRTFCQNLVSKRNASGFQVVLSPGEFNWGSNSGALNSAVLLLIASWKENDLAFRDAALDQLHYMLGVNPHKLSFLTGVGEASTKFPHHRPSASDGIDAPVPGLLAGGANQYLNDDILKALFTSSTPPALCYVDQVGSYASNEIAINWNAPFVFVSGFFSSFGGATNVGKNEDTSPEGSELDQNYPNPFNSSTRISFSLMRAGFVSLKVFDSLGREIGTLVSAMMGPGRYDAPWEARQISSGIYYYTLTTAHSRETKRMVVLK